MLDVGVLLESEDISGRALGEETGLGIMKLLVIEVEGGKHEATEQDSIEDSFEE